MSETDEQYEPVLAWDAVLARIANRLVTAATGDVDAAIERSLTEVGELLGVDRCSLFLYTEDSKDLDMTHGWEREGVSALPMKTRPPLPVGDRFPQLMSRLLQGQPLALEDTAALAGWADSERERIEATGIRALLLVPMFSARHPIGLLALDCAGRARAWTAREQQLVVQLGLFLTHTLLRVRAEQSESAAVSRYHALTESGQALLFEISADGTYTFMSSNVEAMTGFRAEQLIGRSFREFVHPDDVSAMMDKIRAAIVEDVTQPPVLEYRVLHKGGDVHFHRSVVVPLLDAQGRVRAMVGSALDITDLKDTEEELRQESELTRLLVRLAATYINLPSEAFEGAIQQSLEELGRFVGADRAYVFRYDFKAGLAVNTHEWCADGITPHMDDLQALDVREMPEITESHRRGQPFYVAEVTEHPGRALRETLSAQSIRSLLSVPLMMEGECTGMVGFDYVHSAHAPSDSEMHLLSVFAQMLVNMRLRQTVEEELGAQQRRLRDIIAGTDAGTWEWDLATDRMYFNQRWAQMLGLASVHDVPRYSREWFQQAHPEDAKAAMEQLSAHLKGETPNLETELRIRHPQGHWVWILIRGRVSRRDPDGRAELLSGIVFDIEKRKQAEAELRTAASVFTHSGEGILITDVDLKIVDINDAFTRITGYPREEVIGKTPKVLSSGRHDRGFYEDMWSEIAATGRWSGEIWNRRRDGSEYAQRLTISTVRDASGEPQQYVGLFADITAQKNYQRELERMAHYDSLTGLPNRILLGDRLGQAMSLARRNHDRIAVVYMDLDDFKLVNDKLGHQAGDQVLREVAQRFGAALRETDTVARPGGDEFVAVLNGLDSDAQVRPLLQRLLDAVSRPIQVAGNEVEVGVSIGVSFYPQPGQPEADQLLRQADQAMFEAKRKGRNELCFFDPELEQSVRRRHDQQQRIRAGLAANEFVLYYQPQVDLEHGTVSGVEALIRWQHPEQGLLAPGAFLPLIEDPALAAELGQWVIDHALHDLERWNEAGFDFEVAVNVSAAELLASEFPARLAEQLAARPGVAPERMLLEVVETSMLEDVARANEITHACHGLGVNFALDDFGTGFSSLSHLKHLPLKQLKIDRSFVRDMMSDPDDLAIVEAVINLGRAFGLEVLAEGVEEEEHVTTLRQLGCRLAQGYLFAKPMPAAAIAGWVQDWTLPLPARDVPELTSGCRRLLFAEAELRSRRRRLSRIVSQADVQCPVDSVCDQRFSLNIWLEEHADSVHYQAIRKAGITLSETEEQLLRCCRSQQHQQATAVFDEWCAHADRVIGLIQQLRTGA